MIEIGDLEEFGFRIGRLTSQVEIREVSIYVKGIHLTAADNSAYLPSFLGALSANSRYLKSKIDYLKHDRWFRDRNVLEIHNLLLHGDPKQFESELEWDSVVRSQRFSDWGEITDGFVTFLIPYCDRLYLTCQMVNRSTLTFDVQCYVDAVETTPYYLIKTIDEAVAYLDFAE